MTTKNVGAKKKPSALVKRPEAPLAEIDSEKYPVLGADANELASVIKENVGGGTVGINDLDRVKVPTGGATSWSVPGLSGDTDEKEITGIIALWKDNRAFWPEPFGDGAKPPDCYSDDGITGIGAPGGDCATCQFAQFGSHEDGKRQACKAMRTVFIAQEGAILPMVISAPPTSLQPMRKYFLKLASQSIPYYGCVTKLSLVKNKSGAGLAFSQIVPTLVGRLTKEQSTSVKAYADALRPVFARVARTQLQKDGPLDPGIEENPEP